MRKRVLIADSSNIQSAVLKIILSDNGYDVVANCHSAEELLRQVQDTTPDLIVSEVRFKDGRNGIEVIQEIRKNSSVPVIFLTMKNGVCLTESIKSIDHAYLLYKPLTESGIRDALSFLFADSAT